MKIDWTFDDCDDADEAQFEQEWQRVQIQLEGKLAEMPDPASHLRFAVVQGDENPRWTIHAALHMPAVTLFAVGAAQSRREALDQLVAQLAQRIDQADDAPIQLLQRREGLEEITSLLGEWRAQGRSEAFLSFLLPIVTSLGPYIQRELQLRESEDTPAVAEVSAFDVMDDVLVAAWERYSQRDKRVSLDLWLTALADEVLDRLSDSPVSDSLDDELDTPLAESRQFLGDEWDEWIERVAYRESIAMGELLPGQPRIGAWDDMDWEEKQSHMAELLRGLDRQQRQAVVFNLVYGYSPAQIGDFQSRDVADVEVDIAQGINSMRHNFHRHEEDDWEEAFARQQLRSRRGRKSV
jgi:DNA-directed RNA polymerase specialized sigma24 family protein